MRQIHVVDSHTGGEPTRTVVSGGPELGNCSMAARLDRFRTEYDHFRSALVNEPRASDAVVGALLCEPTDRSCAAGVIFFNNVGYLGMCGHGAIGVGATLAYLKRISRGAHFLETPVGIVGIELHENGDVSVDNVASHRAAKDVTVFVEGIGPVTGDVAWGGNWFFLTQSPVESELRNLDQLTNFTCRVRSALAKACITGENGMEIDHIEVFCQPRDSANNSRNFVLCPGKEYDRSPCGTGTSAKLACLYADGKIQQGDVWRQESVLGSVFEGSIRIRDGRVYPRIKGVAFVTADASLVLDEKDPFCWGIPA